MRNKQIAYGILAALVIWFIYQQDIIQEIKNQLIFLAGFGFLAGWLINKYIK